MAAHPWKGAGTWMWGGRGLTRAALAADLALWGLPRPLGFHLTNLLLHAAAALAAFAAGRLLLRSLALPEGAAALGAALFALHPLQGAAVSYVVQRSEILAGLFTFAALACWLRARESGGWGWGAAALTCAQAGILSKENAIAFPGLVLACFLLPGRKGGRGLLTALFGLSAISAVRFFPGLVGLGDAPSALPDGSPREWGVSRHIPWGAYAITELGVVARYLRLLVLPFGQRMDYDWGLDRNPWAFRPLSGLLLLVLLAALAWRLRTRLPLAPWALAWFLTALSPSSSFVPVEDVIMEHRVYTALWGPALLAGALAPLRPVRLAVPALLLGLLSFSRGLVWAEPERLWRDCARRSPGISRPWEAWGDMIRDLGNPTLGAMGLKRALGVDPWNHRAAHNLGRLRAEAGRHEEAVVLFRQCLRAYPLYTDAVLDLSASLWKLGRDAEALPVLREARGLYPRCTMLPYNEGTALLRLNRPAEALEPLSRAVALHEDPDLVQSLRLPSNPRLGLAEALGRTNRAEEARSTVAPLLDSAHPETRRAAWGIFRKACVVLRDVEGIRRADRALR